MKNTTIRKKHEHDKFYTKVAVAKLCVEKLQEILNNKSYAFLEPSAGNGVFVEILKECGMSNIEAMDIAPENDFIKKQDFFTYKPTCRNNIAILGNPPFGRCSNLAIKFF